MTFIGRSKLLAYPKAAVRDRRVWAGYCRSRGSWRRHSISAAMARNCSPHPYSIESSCKLPVGASRSTVFLSSGLARIASISAKALDLSPYDESPWQVSTKSRSLRSTARPCWAGSKLAAMLPLMMASLPQSCRLRPAGMGRLATPKCTLVFAELMPKRRNALPNFLCRNLSPIKQPQHCQGKAATYGATSECSSQQRVTEEADSCGHASRADQCEHDGSDNCRCPMLWRFICHGVRILLAGTGRSPLAASGRDESYPQWSRRSNSWVLFSAGR